MSYISKISLDDSNLPPPTPEIDQERKVAIFDLLEGNSFTLPARDRDPTTKRALSAGTFHTRPTPSL
jgi:uncharacterized protein (UPF0262 family)